IDQRLGTPDTPFVASLVRFRYGLPGCSPPCTDQTGSPAFGDFYFQAFNGSVSLSVAGYNYNSDWTPLLAGLSPAGMAASLAARSISTELGCPRHVRSSPVSDRTAEVALAIF